MFDLYLVVVPFITVQSIVYLYYLKFTLSEPTVHDLSKYCKKLQQTVQSQNSLPQSQSIKSFTFTYKKVLKYLIVNFTVVEFCITKRNRNKIIFCFVFSLEAILSYFTSSIYLYAFSSIGCITVLVFTITSVMPQNYLHKVQNFTTKEPKNLQIKSGKNLQIILTAIGILMNLTVIWFVYKNTQNNFILKLICNFLIIFAIDNCITRPFIFVLLAAILTFWRNLYRYIDNEQQIVEILRGERVLKIQQHKKKHTNCFLNTENTFEIQPCVNFKANENQLQLQNAKKSCIQIVEQSLSQDFKQSSENLRSNSIKRKNKLYPEKPRFDHLFLNVENQEQTRNNPVEQRKISLLEPSFQEPTSSFCRKNPADFNHNEFKNIKLSNEQSPISKNLKQFSNNRQNQSSFSCLSGFHITATKNLIKINQDKKAEDLEQIDMNSPDKRRRLNTEANKNEQTKLYQIKKQKILRIKKFSFCSNKMVNPLKNASILKQLNENSQKQQIKQLTKHETLEIKTNTENSKRDQNRKSEIFSRYSIGYRGSIDNRSSKSFKKTKKYKQPIVRENDENKITEFIIEGFTY